MPRRYDNSSSLAVQKSLNDIRSSEREGADVVANAIGFLTIIAGMGKSEYFVGDDKDPKHFSLGFDQYTQFTSPIRRYADVMVHRVLLAILEEKTVEQFLSEFPASQSQNTRAGMVSQCNHNNLKNKFSREIQQDLDLVYYTMMLQHQVRVGVSTTSASHGKYVLRIFRVAQTWLKMSKFLG